MENISSNTSQSPRRLPPLSHPIVHSASFQRHVAILTCKQARRSLAGALARPHVPATTWQTLRAKFYRCDVCREWYLRLGNRVLRSAVRWPVLQTLLPSIRKRGQWGALLDRAQIESGGELSTSAPAALVRRLKAYRDE